MPRETTGFVLVAGAVVGLVWGTLSLQFGMDTNVWPPVVAPLWITSLIAERVRIDATLLGAVVSALCGMVPVAMLFGAARLRGA
jgi:hypothetical protein